MSTPAISLEHLRKSYGDLVAVDDLTLQIERGEFFGLLGPNGAGKTTTINTVVGLVKPTSGHIFVHGLDALRDYRRVHRLIGIAHQETILDGQFLNAREILIYQAGYFGISPRRAKPRADELLERFGLWEKRSARVHELSGGQKRRLLLAKALMHDPEILILDEPTAGADVELRLQLWEMLQSFHRQGKTILLTTHYLEEAERLCERVVILHEGRLRALGAPSDLVRARQQERLEDVFLELVRSEQE
jgi:ABC-2 type transport system ATP-binding protein